MFTQLDPPIPLHVIGKGDGYALAVIDYGQEHNLIWVTALDANGEIWCAPNPLVRMSRNWTMGRTMTQTTPAVATPCECGAADRRNMGGNDAAKGIGC